MVPYTSVVGLVPANRGPGANALVDPRIRDTGVVKNYPSFDCEERDKCRRLKALKPYLLISTLISSAAFGGI